MGQHANGIKLIFWEKKQNRKKSWVKRQSFEWGNFEKLGSVLGTYLQDKRPLNMV